MEESLEAGSITGWLKDWRSGDQNAQAALFDVIYPELRRIAALRVSGASRNATMNPTELIHEAWIRIAKSNGLSFESRRAFYAATALIMRRVLVDRARARYAQKRDEGFHWPVESYEFGGVDVVGINEAIDALEVVSERQARQVDLRFFGGFSAQETCDILGVSTATLKRDWLGARMFIKHYLEHRVV